MTNMMFTLRMLMLLATCSMAAIGCGGGGGGNSGSPTSPTVCSATITPTSQTFGAGGAAGTVTITTPTGCSWTATSGASWITIAAGSTGTGSGTVNYTVAPNAGAARTGTVTIGGQALTVTQDAATFNGTWRGTAPNTSIPSLELTVRDNAVVQLTVTLSLSSGASTCTSTISIQTNTPITGSGFSLPTPTGFGLSAQIRGSFTGPTAGVLSIGPREGNVNASGVVQCGSVVVGSVVAPRDIAITRS